MSKEEAFFVVLTPQGSGDVGVEMVIPPAWVWEYL
jgi:hypothetical protein